MLPFSGAATITVQSDRKTLTASSYGVIVELSLFYGSYGGKVGAVFHLCCARENGAVAPDRAMPSSPRKWLLRFRRYDTGCVSVKVTGAETEGYTRPSRLREKVGSERNKIGFRAVV